MRRLGFIPQEDYRVKRELQEFVRQFMCEKLKLACPEWDFVGADIKLQDGLVSNSNPFGKRQAIIQIRMESNGLDLV